MFGWYEVITWIEQGPMTWPMVHCIGSKESCEKFAEGHPDMIVRVFELPTYGDRDEL